jgi:hypothetical protein
MDYTKFKPVNRFWDSRNWKLITANIRDLHWIISWTNSIHLPSCEPIFFIASGVGLSPLYCGHFWPIVPAPDDMWGWLWSNRWNEDWQGKPKYSEKTCPSATLSTTNPTWPDPGSNPGRRGVKPSTNRLSYRAAESYKPISIRSSSYHYFSLNSQLDAPQEVSTTKFCMYSFSPS